MTTRDEVVSLWESTQNIEAIANQLNLGSDSIRYHLRKAGIDFKKKEILSRDELYSYLESGLSFSAIARMIGKPVCFVSNKAKKLGLKSSHMEAMAEIALPEPIDVVYSRYIAGTSLDKLHKEYNRPVSTIQNKLLKAYPELKFRTMDEAIRPSILNSKNELFDALHDLSCRKLAKNLGVKISTVTNAAKKFGLNTKQITYAALPVSKLSEFINVGLLPSDIAKKTGLKYGVVLRQIKAAGLPVRTPGGVSRPSKYSVLNDKSWLSQKYLEDNLSTGDLALLIGTSIGNIVHHLKKHGIKMRTRSEYLSDLVKHGKKRTIDGIDCDSNMEEKFLLTLDNETRSTVKKCPILHADHSSCVVDFEVGADFVEVKSPSESKNPGVDRRRLTKQWLICRNNNIDLKVWNGNHMQFVLDDLDKYYAINWRLVFKSYNECFDFLVNYGFKGVEYSRRELVDGLVKVVKVPDKNKFNAAYRNEDVLKLIKHFSQHYWYSTFKDCLPISAAWQNGNYSILKHALQMLWDKAREVNLYGLIKEIQKEYKDFRQPSIFKPWVAHAVYKRLIPNGGVVLDPCMGWGGRLLGIVDLPIKYIGWDINQKAVDANFKLAKFSNSRLRYIPELVCGDALSMAIPKVDLLFTSPPYDDSEIYDGGTRSSLDNILNSIFNRAKCKLAINVAKCYSERVLMLAKKHSLKHIETIEMATNSLIRREGLSEPIFVFE